MDISVTTVLYLPPKQKPVRIDIKDLDHVYQPLLWIGHISIVVGDQEVLGESFDDDLYALWLSLLTQVRRLVDEGRSRDVLPGNDGTAIEFVRKKETVSISVVYGSNHFVHQANLKAFSQAFVGAYFHFAAACIRYGTFSSGYTILESIAEAEKIVSWLNRSTPAFGS